MSKITGIVLCKNEWALIAISITYALLNHADEVWAINHASTDQTASGLLKLKDLWGDRLQIITINMPEFEQEAMTNAAVLAARQHKPDWFYVFDADEFLLVSPPHTLKSILSATRHNCVSVKYPVENYIAPEHFNEFQLGDYRQLRYKSLPGQANCNYEISREAIDSGAQNYFDTPFPSKVIFRNSNLSRIAAGSHNIFHFGSNASGVVDSRLKCAHLPYPSRSRLDKKADAGQNHINLGRSPEKGWQNQLLCKLRNENRLDWFWQRHSIVVQNNANPPTPSYVTDNTLADALEPTLQFLEKRFGTSDLRYFGREPLATGTAPESHLPASVVTAMVLVLLQQTNTFIRNRIPG